MLNLQSSIHVKEYLSETKIRSPLAYFLLKNYCSKFLKELLFRACHLRSLCSFQYKISLYVSVFLFVHLNLIFLVQIFRLKMKPLAIYLFMLRVVLTSSV